MPKCSECRTEFFPRDYLHLCDECGEQLQRQYEALQEFRAGVMSLAELASWAMFGKTKTIAPIWRIG